MRDRTDLLGLTIKARFVAASLRGNGYCTLKIHKLKSKLIFKKISEFSEFNSVFIIDHGDGRVSFFKQQRFYNCIKAA